jgi:hypothetical protein
MAINSDAYNKQQLNVIVKVIGAMNDEAIDQSKKTSNALVEHLQKKIIDASGQTQNLVDDPIAKGSVVSRSKKATIGELNIGFAAQKYSGGGTTQKLWGGAEFGSNKFRQFPSWSGQFGKGSRGWFIYPTLRKEQPYILDQWENAFDKIIKEW